MLVSVKNEYETQFFFSWTWIERENISSGMGHLLISYSFGSVVKCEYLFWPCRYSFHKKIIIAISSFITLKCQTIFYSSQAYSHAIYFDTHTLTVQLGVCATHPRYFYTATVSYLCPNNNNIPATGKSLIEQLVLVTRKSPFFRDRKKMDFSRYYKVTTESNWKSLWFPIHGVYWWAPDIVNHCCGVELLSKRSPQMSLGYNNIIEQRSVPELLPFIVWARW